MGIRILVHRGLARELGAGLRGEEAPNQRPVLGEGKGTSEREVEGWGCNARAI